MRYAPHILSVALLLGVVSQPSRAQCPEDVRLRVQHEIELTDTRIEQATGIVAESGSEAARLELRAATEIQSRAKLEFSAEHCRIALDLTLRARFRATRAIEIVRGSPERGLPDPGRVLTQLERTRDVLQRVRDRIEECRDPRARAILHAAFEMQQRAEDAFAHERYLAAFQLTVSARERGLRALRFCNMQDNLRESAELALRRTDEILGRARDIVADHDGDRARKALHRGLDLQARAWVEFRAERFEASLRLTQSARTLAHRAIRLAGGSP